VIPVTLTGRLCGVVAALAVTLLFSAGAEAGAPQQKTQAPGYYRLMLGEFEVTVLSDGTFQMDAGTGYWVGGAHHSEHHGRKAPVSLCISISVLQNRTAR
jgi:hypothetical protein